MVGECRAGSRGGEGVREGRKRNTTRFRLRQVQNSIERIPRTVFGGRRRSQEVPKNIGVAGVGSSRVTRLISLRS